MSSKLKVRFFLFMAEPKVEPNVEAGLVFARIFLAGDLGVLFQEPRADCLFMKEPRLTRSEKLEEPPNPFAFFLVPPDFNPGVLVFFCCWKLTAADEGFVDFVV